MHERLIEALEKADLAVAAGREVVEPGRLDATAELIQAARTRMQRPDDLLVVALAGGTGSGKSSLFNALTGLEAAAVGGVRPTTAAPLAAVPEGRASAILSLLDELGVEDRIFATGLSHCVIDLPDTDSIEIGHRLTIDSIIPRVDAVVWVVDPVKYRDAALHHRYLRPFAGYAGQFVVALNQVDRLHREEISLVVADLRAALEEDGLSGVPVVVMAAAPPAGPPEGIDDLRVALAAVAAGPILYSKLLTDLRRSGDDMSAAIGPPSRYRERAPAILTEVAALIAAGDRGSATKTLGDFYGKLGGEIGGPVGERISRFASTAPSLIDELSSTDVGAGTRRRWARKKKVSGPSPNELVSRLEEQTRPVADDLAKRAEAAAAVADMGVAVRAALADLPG